MNSLEWIEDNIPKKSIRLLYQYKETNMVGRYAGNYLFSLISFSYDLMSSFIEAQEKVRKQAESFGFDSFDRRHLEPVFRESRQMEKDAKDFLNE